MGFFLGHHAAAAQLLPLVEQFEVTVDLAAGMTRRTG